MNQHATPDAIAALAAAMREHRCGTVPELMRALQVANGIALLARLGCAGNPAALWEQLTYDIASRRTDVASRHPRRRFAA